MNNGSNNLKPLVFGDPVKEGKKLVTKPSNNKQPAQRESFSPLVTTVTTVTTIKNKKTLEIGDRAHYIGTQKNAVKQYAGDLTVYEFSKSMGEVTCVKPDGKLTS